MKVCLISNQIAAWGKIGGFGTATRALGRGLAESGLDVAAVVPRRTEAGQARLEHLDGITVYGTSIRETLFSSRIYREVAADIYHSQEPTIASWHARRAAPEAVHVVTCRDPRGFKDHLVELRYTSHKRRLIAPATWLYEASPMVKSAVRNADAVFMSAPTRIFERIKRLYGDGVNPQFVPSPVILPDRIPDKDPDPLVLFVGRWDHRKRVERFFDLAKRFPDVRFVAVGRAHDDAYDARLRARYGSLSNLDMPGFLSLFDGETLGCLYERAWVLVNTSAREGLPYTFLEAAAWECAILSTLNPEQFASRFGHHASTDTQDELEAGLRNLLEGDEWRRRGQAAGEYVRSIWREEDSFRLHIEKYEILLGGQR